MEAIQFSRVQVHIKLPDLNVTRKAVSCGLTGVGLWAMYNIYSHHWDPLGFLIIGFFIAPLILPFLGLGWDGIRIMLLASVAVALAAFVLRYVYLGLLFPVAYMMGSGPYLFILVACILAPIFEEVVKGSLWILERGNWRHGAAIGLGFGCFEATSYLIVYGVDIAFLRWQGTILHVVATALMFEGFHRKEWRFILGALGLHMAHNFTRIVIAIL